MARRRKLKLPPPPDSEPAVPLARLAAGLGVMVALGLLVVQVGGRVLDGEQDPPDAHAEAPVPALGSSAPILSLRALENVSATVEIDGETVFQGTLSGGSERSWPAGRVTAVELDDLTRASVRYDGQQIEPLGSLSTARRLEFIDDL